MNINQFIKNFEAEIEELEGGNLKAETVFKDLPQWNSMQALIIIAMVNAEYDVTISAEELKEAQTITDLFNIIKKKRQEVHG